MQRDLIIFDLDGTLADSLPALLRVMEDVTRRFRLRSVPPEELPALRLLGAREIMKRIGLSWWRLPRVALAVREGMAQRVGEIVLFPGVAEALERLHARGKRFALVTSNSEANARAILGESLVARFPVLECSTALFGKKARFTRVLKHTRIAAEAALCIGDELRDAEAARAAGIAFGAVTWGYSDAAVLRRENPAFVFGEPRELGEIP